MGIEMSSEVASVRKGFATRSTSYCPTPYFMFNTYKHTQFLPNGRCPVWARIWPFKSHGLENIFPHTWHLCEAWCVNKCMLNAGIET